MDRCMDYITDRKNGLLYGLSQMENMVCCMDYNR